MSTKFNIVTSAADGCGKQHSTRLAGGSRNFHLFASAVATSSALAIGGMIGVASATTVNIQFESFGGSFNGQLGAYAGDGVASPTWNVFPDASASASGLLSSDGTPTTVALSYSAYGTYSYGGSSNWLLSGWLESPTATNSSETVTLTGLTDNGAYQLYLYGSPGAFAESNSATVGAAFSITTGTGGPIAGSDAFTSKTNDAANWSTFTENANYVIFDAVANPTGTMGITFSNSTESVGQNGVFNGLQLISSSVPAPNSLGLFSIGALGLLLLAKRKTVGIGRNGI